QMGLGPAVRARQETFPAFVVFPQARELVPETFDRAMAILDAVQNEFRTDPRRTYLTGISVGGHGVWQLAAGYPDRWAAIVPVCAIDLVTKAGAIKHIPCWCFHGADDGKVSAEHS